VDLSLGEFRMVTADKTHLKGTILVAEDEPAIRESLAEVLREDGHWVACAPDGTAAIAALDTQEFDLVLSDLRMPGADGLAVLKHARDVAPQTLVLLMTAFATLDTAVEALRRGAHDYLPKPLIFEDVLYKVGYLLRHRQLAWENEILRAELESRCDLDALLGQSSAMRTVFDAVRVAARSSVPVLITGERGVGHEVVARALHRLSPRGDGIFLRLDCAAAREPELERQLFGHLRGAFAGAVNNEEGLLPRASGGTLLLERIAELPRGVQARLMRVVESGEILPIGSTAPMQVDVRLIAASAGDLLPAVTGGHFREDLYYRLKGFVIEIPPLRERREDIPVLVDHFVRVYNHELKRNVRGADPAALERLVELPWHGNARELANAIEYAMIVSRGEWITVRDLPHSPCNQSVSVDQASNLREGLRAYEKAHIEAVLAEVQQDKRAAARRLGVSLSSLYRKIAELEISRLPGDARPDD